LSNFFIDIDRISELMGDQAGEFIECMKIVQDIIDRPETYVGGQAIRYANQLAAYRTTMIIKSQMYKRKSSMMVEEDKFTNDIWKTMYEALGENINVLKLAARTGVS